MNGQNDVQWAEINDLVLNCGKAKTPHELAANMFESIDSLVPFDQGRIYTLNSNYEVSADTLFGVDKYWPRAYYEYYSQILNGKYSLRSEMRGNRKAHEINAGISVYEWTKIKDDEFVSDYIRPQRILHTIGFGLFDTQSACKRVCMIDRTSRRGFSKSEVDTVAVVVSHLENLHHNFYRSTEDECAVGRIGTEEALTSREREIADMICKGYAPQKIASTLFVSRATVYKHIAHIHTKMGVSNRQELIVKLLKRN
jgi:DNA-binding CsgD family transcriptional regulator